MRSFVALGRGRTRPGSAGLINPLTHRLYSDASPWNTLISSPSIYTNTETTIDEIKKENSSSSPYAHDGFWRNWFTTDTTQYAYPIHYVTNATALQTVTFSGVVSIVNPEGVINNDTGGGTIQVRLPVDAQPSLGSDAQIISVNLDTGTEVGFWGFANSGGTMTATNGYSYNINWSGIPPSGFVSRGAGVPYLTGAIRKVDYDRGVIDHALAIAYDWPSSSFVSPATKSDGVGPETHNTPEGARLMLRPDYPLQYVPNGSIQKMILQALRDYGAFIIDNAGQPKIFFEDETTASWGSILPDNHQLRPWLAIDDLVAIDWTGSNGAGNSYYPGWNGGAAGIGGTPAQQGSTVVSTNSNSAGMTSPFVTGTVTPSANEYVLVIVAYRLNTRDQLIHSVTGNGITYRYIRRWHDAQNVIGLELWGGSAASPSSGTISIAHSDNITAISSRVVRMTAASKIIQVRSADQGGTDTNSPSVTLDSVASGSLLLGVVARRQRGWTTSPSGWTLISEDGANVGTAPNSVRLSVYSKSGVTGSQALSGTLSATDEWIAFEAELT